MISRFSFLIRPASFVLLLTIGAITSAAAQGAEQTTYYVASDGNDAWSGRLPAPNAAKDDGPFASLRGARDAIRQLKVKEGLGQGGVSVVVRGGTYIIEQPLEFTTEDSGVKDSPISYSAAAGEPVRLLAGKVVADWQPVTDAGVLGRLDVAARGKMVQADLRALGVSDFGSPSGGGIELFFNGEPMTVSRWPNEGFVSIVGRQETSNSNVSRSQYKPQPSGRKAISYRWQNAQLDLDTKCAYST